MSESRLNKIPCQGLVYLPNFVALCIPWSMPQQDPGNLATALYEYSLLYGCLSWEAWLTISQCLQEQFHLFGVMSVKCSWYLCENLSAINIIMYYFVALISLFFFVIFIISFNQKISGSFMSCDILSHTQTTPSFWVDFVIKAWMLLN